MSQIILKNLDSNIEKKIRLKVRKSREILQLKTDTDKKKRTPRGQSLKSLVGGWSDQEAAEFFESIKSREQIDEDTGK